jgi:hypothetical protein
MPSNAYVTPSFDLQNKFSSPQSSTNPILDFIIEKNLANNFLIPSFTSKKKNSHPKVLQIKILKNFYKCFCHSNFLNQNLSPKNSPNGNHNFII